MSSIHHPRLCRIRVGGIVNKTIVQDEGKHTNMSKDLFQLSFWRNKITKRSSVYLCDFLLPFVVLLANCSAQILHRIHDEQIIYKNIRERTRKHEYAQELLRLLLRRNTQSEKRSSSFLRVFSILPLSYRFTIHALRPRRVPQTLPCALPQHTRIWYHCFIKGISPASLSGTKQWLITITLSPVKSGQQIIKETAQLVAPSPCCTDDHARKTDAILFH